MREKEKLNTTKNKKADFWLKKKKKTVKKITAKIKTKPKVKAKIKLKTKRAKK